MTPYEIHDRIEADIRKNSPGLAPDQIRFFEGNGLGIPSGTYAVLATIWQRFGPCGSRDDPPFRFDGTEAVQ